VTCTPIAGFVTKASVDHTAGQLQLNLVPPRGRSVWLSLVEWGAPTLPGPPPRRPAHRPAGRDFSRCARDERCVQGQASLPTPSFAARTT